jgi:hypothetical protein
MALMRKGTPVIKYHYKAQVRAPIAVQRRCRFNARGAELWRIRPHAFAVQQPLPVPLAR